MMAKRESQSQFDPRLRGIAERQPHPLLFASLSGAHLYGFPSKDSDWDLRGVHVLPAREVVGLDHGPDTLEAHGDDGGLDLDLVTHDAAKFFGLMLRRNGYVLEQVLSPLVVLTTPAHGELKALAPACITRHHAHHYRGFFGTEWALCQKQAARRAKPLLYCYRVLLTGIHLMRTGVIESNLPRLLESHGKEVLGKDGVAEVMALVALKAEGGEMASIPEAAAAEHDGRVEATREAFEAAAAACLLPEQPTARPALHDLLVRIRLQGPGPAATP
jgi:hypothetical protein